MTDNEIYHRALLKIEENDKELFIPSLIVDREELYDWEIYYIIFSHEFAKAFWGDSRICKCNQKETNQVPYTCEGHLFENVFGACTFDKSWKYHLQQMVLEKEPLKYLEKFLKD